MSTLTYSAASRATMTLRNVTMVHLEIHSCTDVTFVIEDSTINTIAITGNLIMSSLKITNTMPSDIAPPAVFLTVDTSIAINSANISILNAEYTTGLPIVEIKGTANRVTPTADHPRILFDGVTHTGSGSASCHVVLFADVEHDAVSVTMQNFVAMHHAVTGSLVNLGSGSVVSSELTLDNVTVVGTELVRWDLWGETFTNRTTDLTAQILRSNFTLSSEHEHSVVHLYGTASLLPSPIPAMVDVNDTVVNVQTRGSARVFHLQAEAFATSWVVARSTISVSNWESTTGFLVVFDRMGPNDRRSMVVFEDTTVVAHAGSATAWGVDVLHLHHPAPSGGDSAVVIRRSAFDLAHRNKTCSFLWLGSFTALPYSGTLTIEHSVFNLTSVTSSNFVEVGRPIDVTLNNVTVALSTSDTGSSTATNAFSGHTGSHNGTVGATLQATNVRFTVDARAFFLAMVPKTGGRYAAVHFEDVTVDAAFNGGDMQASGFLSANDDGQWTGSSTLQIVTLHRVVFAGKIAIAAAPGGFLGDYTSVSESFVAVDSVVPYWRDTQFVFPSKLTIQNVTALTTAADGPKWSPQDSVLENAELTFKQVSFHGVAWAEMSNVKITLTDSSFTEWPNTGESVRNTSIVLENTNVTAFYINRFCNDSSLVIRGGTFENITARQEIESGSISVQDAFVNFTNEAVVKRPSFLLFERTVNVSSVTVTNTTIHQSPSAPSGTKIHILYCEENCTLSNVVLDSTTVTATVVDTFHMLSMERSIEIGSLVIRQCNISVNTEGQLAFIGQNVLSTPTDHPLFVIESTLIEHSAIDLSAPNSGQYIFFFYCNHFKSAIGPTRIAHSNLTMTGWHVTVFRTRSQLNILEYPGFTDSCAFENTTLAISATDRVIFWFANIQPVDGGSGISFIDSSVTAVGQICNHFMYTEANAMTPLLVQRSVISLLTSGHGSYDYGFFHLRHSGAGVKYRLKLEDSNISAIGPGSETGSDFKLDFMFSASFHDTTIIRRCNITTRGFARVHGLSGAFHKRIEIEDSTIEASAAKELRLGVFHKTTSFLSTSIRNTTINAAVVNASNPAIPSTPEVAGVVVLSEIQNLTYAAVGDLAIEDSVLLVSLACSFDCSATESRVLSQPYLTDRSDSILVKNTVVNVTRPPGGAVARLSYPNKEFSWFRLQNVTMNQRDASAPQELFIVDPSKIRITFQLDVRTDYPQAVTLFNVSIPTLMAGPFHTTFDLTIKDVETNTLSIAGHSGGKLSLSGVKVTGLLEATGTITADQFTIEHSNVGRCVTFAAINVPELHVSDSTVQCPGWLAPAPALTFEATPRLHTVAVHNSTVVSDSVYGAAHTLVVSPPSTPGSSMHPSMAVVIKNTTVSAASPVVAKTLVLPSTQSLEVSHNSKVTATVEPTAPSWRTCDKRTSRDTGLASNEWEGILVTEKRVIDFTHHGLKNFLGIRISTLNDYSASATVLIRHELGLNEIVRSMVLLRGTPGDGPWTLVAAFGQTRQVMSLDFEDEFTFPTMTRRVGVASPASNAPDVPSTPTPGDEVDLDSVNALTLFNGKFYTIETNENRSLVVSNAETWVTVGSYRGGLVGTVWGIVVTASTTAYIGGSTGNIYRLTLNSSDLVTSSTLVFTSGFTFIGQMAMVDGKLWYSIGWWVQAIDLDTMTVHETVDMGRHVVFFSKNGTRLITRASGHSPQPLRVTYCPPNPTTAPAAAYANPTKPSAVAVATTGASKVSFERGALDGVVSISESSVVASAQGVDLNNDAHTAQVLIVNGSVPRFELIQSTVSSPIGSRIDLPLSDVREFTLDRSTIENAAFDATISTPTFSKVTLSSTALQNGGTVKTSDAVQRLFVSDFASTSSNAPVNVDMNDVRYVSRFSNATFVKLNVSMSSLTADHTAFENSHLSGMEVNIHGGSGQGKRFSFENVTVSPANGARTIIRSDTSSASCGSNCAGVNLDVDSLTVARNTAGALGADVDHELMITGMFQSLTLDKITATNGSVAIDYSDSVQALHSVTIQNVDATGDISIRGAAATAVLSCVSLSNFNTQTNKPTASPASFNTARISIDNVAAKTAIIRSMKSTAEAIGPSSSVSPIRGIYVGIASVEYLSVSDLTASVSRDAATATSAEDVAITVKIASVSGTSKIERLSATCTGSAPSASCDGVHVIATGAGVGVAGAFNGLRRVIITKVDASASANSAVAMRVTFQNVDVATIFENEFTAVGSGATCATSGLDFDPIVSVGSVTVKRNTAALRCPNINGGFVVSDISSSHLSLYENTVTATGKLAAIAAFVDPITAASHVFVARNRGVLNVPSTSLPAPTPVGAVLLGVGSDALTIDGASTLHVSRNNIAVPPQPSTSSPNVLVPSGAVAAQPLVGSTAAAILVGCNTFTNISTDAISSGSGISAGYDGGGYTDTDATVIPTAQQFPSSMFTVATSSKVSIAASCALTECVGNAVDRCPHISGFPATLSPAPCACTCGIADEIAIPQGPMTDQCVGPASELVDGMRAGWAASLSSCSPVTAATTRTPTALRAIVDFTAAESETAIQAWTAQRQLNVRTGANRTVLLLLSLVDNRGALSSSSSLTLVASNVTVTPAAISVTDVDASSAAAGAGAVAISLKLTESGAQSNGATFAISATFGDGSTLSVPNGGVVVKPGRPCASLQMSVPDSMTSSDFANAISIRCVDEHGATADASFTDRSKIIVVVTGGNPGGVDDTDSWVGAGQQDGDVGLGGIGGMFGTVARSPPPNVTVSTSMTGNRTVVRLPIHGKMYAKYDGTIDIAATVTLPTGRVLTISDTTTLCQEALGFPAEKNSTVSIFSPVLDATSKILTFTGVTSRLEHTSTGVSNSETATCTVAGVVVSATTDECVRQCDLSSVTLPSTSVGEVQITGHDNRSRSISVIDGPVSLRVRRISPSPRTSLPSQKSGTLGVWRVQAFSAADLAANDVSATAVHLNRFLSLSATMSDGASVPADSITAVHVPDIPLAGTTAPSWADGKMSFAEERLPNAWEVSIPDLAAIPGGVAGETSVQFTLTALSLGAASSGSSSSSDSTTVLATMTRVIARPSDPLCRSGSVTAFVAARNCTLTTSTSLTQCSSESGAGFNAQVSPTPSGSELMVFAVGGKFCTNVAYDGNNGAWVVNGCPPPEAPNSTDSLDLFSGFVTEGSGSLPTIRGGSIYAASALTVQYGVSVATKPLVQSVSGCSVDAYPSTALCSIENPTSLTILGARFPLAWTPASLHISVDVQSPWPTVVCAVTSVNETTILCTLPGGLGQKGKLIVKDLSNGGSIVATASDRLHVSYVSLREDECAITNNGVCNGHGRCVPATGLCDCDAAVNSGFWTGAACDSCALMYQNSSGCNARCPGMATPCDGRGVCANGVCTECVEPYVGTNCSVRCPGMTIKCNGHGTCSAVDGSCACSGNYTGTSCSECVSTHVGSSCELACPSVGALNASSMCSGRGTCLVHNGAAVCQCPSGYCGTSCESQTCSACPSGLFGNGCQFECPGGVATPCTLHGNCSGGQAGTGLCTCNPGRYGAACENECPRDGSSGAVCAGHGRCAADTDGCVCDATYATSSCSVECPGTNAAKVVCSGHGQCSSGANGNGTCECAFGWAGPACDVECPGGAAAPCTNRGQCQQQGPSAGTCVCNANTNVGFWSGAACDECAAGYAGDQCLLRCPTGRAGQYGTVGAVCGGHGTCAGSGECTCSSSSTTGYWTGAACDTCGPRHFGVGCVSLCPGSECSVCSGHGSCNSQTGACTCLSGPVTGNWFGTACDTCASGQYGSLCNKQCPSCEQGTCNDGPRGDGQCACNANWKKASDGRCTECLTNFYGPACTRCPIAANGQPCSGNGTCNSGVQGDGACTCSIGFDGPQCEFACPVFNGRNCGGHGRCATSPGCKCDTGYGGVSCSDCAVDKFGPFCNQTCTVCQNGGSCRNGVAGDGTCQCLPQFIGAQCEAACPLSNGTACAGHGVCEMASPATATCSCFSNASHGYYSGAACGACLPMFESSGCRLQCPTVNNVICNNRGTCFDGKCSECAPLAEDTSTIVCGNDCGSFGAAACFTVTCPTGFWGAGCTNLCPGAAPDGSGSCSSIGTCNPDTGSCICPIENAGAKCELTCPVVTLDGRQRLCGHGTCVADNKCVCGHGYWGPSCINPCPSGPEAPCSGTGSCSPITGQCTCPTGLAGTSCELVCPGGQFTPCNGHGRCKVDATCTCVDSDADGHFAGESCDRCVSGWGGGDCRSKCSVSSETRGLECQCFTSFAGRTCTIACPRAAGAGAVCNNNGICFDGATGNGTCSCNKNWYGPICQTACSVSEKCTHLANGQCSSTGECECAATIAAGFWAGAKCADCRAGYWGPSCRLQCACNGHGTCERDTGSCQCYGNPERGYWGGEACASCRGGYIGGACQSINIESAQQRDLLVSAGSAVTAPHASASTGFRSWHDTARQMSYTFGGGSILAFHRPNKTVAPEYLGRVPISTASAVVSSNSDVIAMWLAAATGEVLALTVSVVDGSMAELRFPVGRAGWGGSGPAGLTSRALGDMMSVQQHVSSRQLQELSINTTDLTESPATCSPRRDHNQAEASRKRLPALDDVATVNNDETSHGTHRSVAQMLASTPAPSTAVLCGGRDEATGVTALVLGNREVLLRRGASNKTITTTSSAIDAVARCSVEAGHVVIAGASNGLWAVVLLPLPGGTAGDVLPSEDPLPVLLTTANVSAAVKISADAKALVATAVAALRCNAVLKSPPTTTTATIGSVTTTTISRTAVVLCMLRPAAGQAIALRVDATTKHVTGGGGSSASASTDVFAACATEVQSTTPNTDASAIAFDGTSTALVGVSESAKTSALHRVHLEACVVTSIHALRRVGSQFEQIISADADTEAREAIIGISVNAAVELRSFNLFGVSAITPTVLDAEGGTVLTVSGEGFTAPTTSTPASASTSSSVVETHAAHSLAAPTTSDNATVFCVFDGGNAVPGVLLSSSSIRCVAPALSTSTAVNSQCAASLINVKLGVRSTAATNVPYQQVATATASKALTGVRALPFSGAEAAAVVTLTGTGFTPASSATCRLRDARGSLTRLSTVAFVNSTASTCRVQAGLPATRPPTVIEYSHDGTIFGSLAHQTAPFALVGIAAGVAIRSPASGVTVPSGIVGRVPPIVSHVIDRMGNSLDYLDNSRRAVKCEIRRGRSLSGEPLAFSADAVTTTSTTEGKATLSSVLLSRPAVGVVTVIVDIGGWHSSLTAKIVPGPPALLTLVSGPMIGASSSTSSTSTVAVRAAQGTGWVVGTSEEQTLDPSPEMTVTDAAGNEITEAASMPATASVRWSSLSSSAGAAVITAVAANTVEQRRVATVTALRYTFNDVKMRGVFGGSYSLIFEASGVVPLTVVVPVKYCNNVTEYGEIGTTRCLQCPTLGVCDGGTEIRPRPGAWRSRKDSYEVYSCLPPHSAGSCDDNGVCKDGYHGARCSECDDEYGKVGLNCVKCSSTLLNWALLSVMAIIVVIVLYIIVYFTVKTAQRAIRGDVVEKDMISIAYKMLVNHVQVAAVCALANDNAGNVIDSFFGTGKTASSVTVDLSFISCTLAGAYRSRLFLISVAPVALVAALAFIRGAQMTAHRQAHRLTARPTAGISGPVANVIRNEELKALTFQQPTRDAQIDEAKIAVRIKQNRHALAPGASGDFTAIGPSSGHHRPVSFTNGGQSGHDYSGGHTTESGLDQCDSMFHDHRHAGLESGVYDTSAAFECVTSEGDITTSSPQSAALFPQLSSQQSQMMLTKSSDMKSGEHKLPSAEFRKDRSGSSLAFELGTDIGRKDGLSPSPSMNASHTASGQYGPAVVGLAGEANAKFLGPVVVSPRTPQASRTPRSGRSSNADKYLVAPSPAGPHALSPSSSDHLSADASVIVERRHRSDPPLSAGDGHHQTLSGGQPHESPQEVSELTALDAPAHVVSSSPLNTGRESSRKLSSRRPSEKKLKGAVARRNARVAAAVRRELDLLKAESERKVRPALTEWLEFVAVAVVVVLFMLYPTIVETAAAAFRCEDIDYGSDGVKSLLVTDRSIDCDSNEYRSLIGLALPVLIAYGVGLPIAMVLLVLMFSKLTLKNEMGSAIRLFGYVTGGYREERWWWETTIFARKFLLSVIAVVVTSNRMRGYAMSWVLAISVVAASVFQSYESTLLSTVESASLATIMATTNVLLLYDFYTENDDPAAFWSVTAVVLIINTVMLLGLLVVLVFSLRLKIEALVDAHPGALGWVRDYLLRVPAPALSLMVDRRRRDVNEVKGVARFIHKRMIAMESIASIANNNNDKKDKKEKKDKKKAIVDKNPKVMKTEVENEEEVVTSPQFQKAALRYVQMQSEWQNRFAIDDPDPDLLAALYDAEMTMVKSLLTREDPVAPVTPQLEARRRASEFGDMVMMPSGVSEYEWRTQRSGESPRSVNASFAEPQSDSPARGKSLFVRRTPPPGVGVKIVSPVKSPNPEKTIDGSKQPAAASLAASVKTASPGAPVVLDMSSSDAASPGTRSVSIASPLMQRSQRSLVSPMSDGNGTTQIGTGDDRGSPVGSTAIRAASPTGLPANILQTADLDTRPIYAHSDITLPTALLDQTGRAAGATRSSVSSGVKAALGVAGGAGAGVGVGASRHLAEFQSFSQKKDPSAPALSSSIAGAVLSGSTSATEALASPPPHGGSTRNVLSTRSDSTAVGSQLHRPQDDDDDGEDPLEIRSHGHGHDGNSNGSDQPENHHARSDTGKPNDGMQDSVASRTSHSHTDSPTPVSAFASLGVSASFQAPESQSSADAVARGGHPTVSTATDHSGKTAGSKLMAGGSPSIVGSMGSGGGGGPHAMAAVPSVGLQPAGSMDLDDAAIASAFNTHAPESAPPQDTTATVQDEGIQGVDSAAFDLPTENESLAFQGLDDESPSPAEGGDRGGQPSEIPTATKPKPKGGSSPLHKTGGAGSPKMGGAQGARPRPGAQRPKPGAKPGGKAQGRSPSPRGSPRFPGGNRAK